MNRTGVVIVTYNSADVIGACLDSCRSLPAIVVDNASADNTVEEVRKRGNVALIANARNRGFAAAVNQGVSALVTDFTLLLNPDVELKTAVTDLEDACCRAEFGLAAGKLLTLEGAPQTGFLVRRFPHALTLIFEVLGFNRLFPGNPVNRRYRCLDFNASAAADVEQPAGAFLLFRRDAWQRLNGFDERFHPLWFEDVDFCRRAGAAGLRIRYVPTAAAAHRGGHSVASLNWSCREVYWYVSLLRYASKHFRPWPYRGVAMAVVLGSAFRMVAGIVLWRSLKPVRVYARVAHAAAACMLSGRAPQPRGEPSLGKAVRLRTLSSGKNDKDKSAHLHGL